jgi:hypothetical protein
MKKTFIVFFMVFIPNIICGQNFMTEIVINGNTSYLDNLLEVDQINDFTLNELRILRNTIFAKYGYKFTSDDLTVHFSQFPWYEGTKASVENELTLIDWKNIKLIKILEDYYPTKIDYVFNFSHNGIYKLDDNFVLTPIYTNNTDIVWWASFGYYIQIDDILFFDFMGTKGLLYDYKINFIFNMRDIGMEEIVSIYYESKNTLVVNGTGILRTPAPERRWYRGPFSVTIEFPDDRFNDEIIGRTTYNNYTWSSEYVTEKTTNLFSIFDKNIITIQENGYPPDQYIDFIAINVIYNNIYNIYFILIINKGYHRQ